MNIYVVTTGEYSDYHILGVYSTKEKAKACVKSYGAACAETYELDEYTPRVGYYGVTIKKNFEASAYPHILEPYELEKENGIPSYVKNLNSPSFSIGGDDANLYWNMEAKDEKTAIKVASEKLTQILALEIWNDNDAVRKLFKRSRDEIA